MLFQSALSAYQSFSDYRTRRQRLIRYTFGDQWAEQRGDYTEAELLYEQGREPVVLNLIGRTVRMLVARFRKLSDGRYDSVPKDIVSENSLPEIDARLLEEFIISGAAIQAVGPHPVSGRPWVENINPARFFAGFFSDQRASDIQLIGRVHLLNWSQFFARFGRDSRYTLNVLRQAFDEAFIPGYSPLSFLDRALQSESRTDRVIEVYEVWCLEPSRKSGKDVKLVWRRRFFTSRGSHIPTRDDRRAFPNHPFILKFYPFIDGEIHSYVEDLIERQRSINRILTSFEASCETAAKGGLLFPRSQLVSGMSFADVGEIWAKPDAVIPISGWGEFPKQVMTNLNSSGIAPIIDMQIKLFDEAAGLSDALKGSLVASNISADTRQAILDNAASAIADLLDTFDSFLAARNTHLSQDK